MKLSILFIALNISIFLVACSSGSDGNPQKGVFASVDDLPACTDSIEGKVELVGAEEYVCQDGIWDLKDSAVATALDSLSGYSEKGPFVKGSKVYAYELSDGYSLSQTGNTFVGTIESDDGKFNISAVTLVSQYALLQAEGYYRNEVTGKTSSSQIILKAITDLTSRATANVNLLTHLEYNRVLYLVKKKGMRVKAAKKQAEKEIFAAFGIDASDFGYSEDLSIFGKKDANAALLAVSILLQRNLTEAELTQELSDFGQNFAEGGTWENDSLKAAIADWASEESVDSLKDHITSWNLGSVPNFAKYIGLFLANIYGLGTCDSLSLNTVEQNTNKKSASYGKSYICKSDGWQEADAWDVMGTCDAVQSLLYETKMYDGEKYLCHKGFWRRSASFGKITDSRDSQTYLTVKIDSQGWMAENLNYSDSATSPNLKKNSWCYQDSAKYCNLFGRLYSWSAAMNLDAAYGAKSADSVIRYPHKGLCPDGWHIPTKKEFQRLENFVGVDNAEALKSETAWNYNLWRGKYNGTDQYGFNVLPAGVYAGTFNSAYLFSAFWTATETMASSAYDWNFLNSSNSTILYDDGKSYGISIRCANDYDAFLIDTDGWGNGKDGDIKLGNVNTDIYFVYDGDSWRNTSKTEQSFKTACTAAMNGDIKMFNGSAYVCDTPIWRIALVYDYSLSDLLNQAISYDSLTDSRDGKKYSTITIGSQTWIAQNLNYSDSTKTTSLKGNSWCYDNNSTNCNIGGRLYTWTAAMNICPDGWHLPDSTEWNALALTAGGENVAFKKLKSLKGWSAVNGNGTDDYGFTALPAGYYYDDGSSNNPFYNEGRLASFWTQNEESSTKAKFYSLGGSMGLNGVSKAAGFSVRCIKN